MNDVSSLVRESQDSDPMSIVVLQRMRSKVGRYRWTCISTDDAKLSHFWGRNSISGSQNDQQMISLTGVEIIISALWSNTHHFAFSYYNLSNNVWELEIRACIRENTESSSRDCNIGFGPKKLLSPKKLILEVSYFPVLEGRINRKSICLTFHIWKHLKKENESY